ncbi:hypothetical protein AAG747_29090 [Rapidithrix thailandica]|uniref:Restriction endonuclease n=1 Tax=Rapidithrix thailandica TaxID=413964 RepID=A0AAW9SMK9_9BACT
MDIEQRKCDAFEEALRLIHKFFPESRSVFSKERGMDIYNFVAAMKFCDCKLDVSCDPFGIPSKPDLGLNKKGGFNGEYDIIFERLLNHANFLPSGRCVIIPDTINENAWSKHPVIPIVCDWKMAGQRIKELESGDLFRATSFDSLFVFESGEAMGVDHDNRFFWAKSKKRKYKK